VLIYSNNTADKGYALKAVHVKNRRFTNWVAENAKQFTLLQHIRNKFASASFGTLSWFTDFYMYKKTG
jgi:hypothetical protein